MGSNKEVIEEIRLHNDIVETIERYVPLKKAGARFRALCPFHKEKTPSFHVDPAKQVYHCFGCGAGGDVFSFVMQYENVDFPEAARILAERAGIRFDRSGTDQPRDGTDKSRLYKLHEDLAHFYADVLQKSETAERGRAYLAERELDEATTDFQLGYAPSQPNAIMKWAEKKQYAAALLEKAGVVLPSDRGGAPYDRFKGRLMFPIRDEQGRVVAFSGRILDDSSPAKYVNSPETPLFKKSRVLYGLDRARRAMTNERQAIVCEGQIDVIRCHLAGITTAVAPQGTALTEAHALLLKRYADEIVLVFDSDTAGQNAALRGAEVLLQEGLTVRVAALPAGEDPDTLIRTQGPETFTELVNNAQSLVAFQVGVLRGRGELDSQAGQLRGARAVLQTIAHAPSAIQREQYVREAAEQLKTSEDALRQDMMRVLRPGRAQTTDTASVPTAPDSYPRNELTLIELMIAHPEVLDLVSQYVPPDAVTNETCRKIIRHIMTMPEPDPARLAQELAGEGPEIQRLVAKTQMTARTLTSDEASCVHAARDIILNLRIRLLDRKIGACRDQMKDAPAKQQRALENERSQLMYLKKKLEDAAIRKTWDATVPILDMDD